MNWLHRVLFGYRHARAFGVREIAQTTLYYREAKYQYRDGLVDEAVRRCAGIKSKELLLTMLEDVFREYEIGPRYLPRVSRWRPTNSRKRKNGKPPRPGPRLAAPR